MKRYLIMPILAVVGFTMLLSFFAAASLSHKRITHSEEYLQQHDGGDGAEYLQEMENSDPWFYVPPVSDASISTTNDNATR